MKRSITQYITVIFRLLLYGDFPAVVRRCLKDTPIKIKAVLPLRIYKHFVNLQLKKEHDAAVDFQNVDNAFALYNSLRPRDKVVLRNKPQLSDYYTSSNAMKNYDYLWIILGMSGVGVLIYWYFVKK